MSTPQPTTKKRKGPRPKHIPQRTCVVCREHTAKRSLIRIVRTPEGNVEVDPTGKKNGRGAYLCDQRACWDRAVTSNVLAKALNTELTHETLDELRRFAASLPDSEPATNAVGAGSKDHA